MVIPGHWNGPPGSANGGYTCGAVAALLEAPSAEVSLRAPPPLDTELAVEREDGLGAPPRRLDARGRGTTPPRRPAPEPPRRVTLDEAEAASRAGLELWAANHPFPTCVVCGPERDDGIGRLPRALDDYGILGAARWDVAEARSRWAALDCPSSAPIAQLRRGQPVVLARLQAALGGCRCGESSSPLSWPLRERGASGRRPPRCSQDGGPCASARALWIQLREA